MEITTDQVKSLRAETKVSIMQCKKALEEADGDAEKAKVLLRKQSAQIASKKQERTLGSGVIGSYTHNGGGVAAMIELLCETDFVAKNEDFKKLAYEIAMHVAATAPEFVSKDEVKEEDTVKARAVFEKEAEGKPEEIKEKIIQGKLDSYFGEKILLEQAYIKNPEQTIAGLIAEAVQKFGEKTEIGRIVRFSVLE